MPDTRPGIRFIDGLCAPCYKALRGPAFPIEERRREFEDLCDFHREINGANHYDCIIPVSSGKDSYFQVKTMRDMGMNPLLVTIDNFSWTETGWANRRNMSDVFGCDQHIMSLSRRTARILGRYGFEKELRPNWYWDRVVYAYPIKLALQLGIRLVVYGENVSYEYGGVDDEETPSAYGQVANGVAPEVPWREWLAQGLAMKDLQPAVYPREMELRGALIEPIYLSYYTGWSAAYNLEVAEKHGFRRLNEWHRDGLCEDYEQIDTIGYNVHPWLKFIKFGHQHNTDVLSRTIREGMISRDSAAVDVLENESILDCRMVADFCDFHGYTGREFYDIIEKHANREILEKDNRVIVPWDSPWRLRPEVQDALIRGGEVDFTTETGKCPKCEGCGKIANTKDQEPWTVWLDMPVGSATAVIMGLVRPLECPACHGSGKENEE